MNKVGKPYLIGYNDDINQVPECHHDARPNQSRYKCHDRYSLGYIIYGKFHHILSNDQVSWLRNLQSDESESLMLTCNVLVK